MQIAQLCGKNQHYVQLTVDSQENRVQMAFLGKDLHTVFSTAPGGPGTGFTFSFSNGVVFPDHIQFDSGIQVPENPQSWIYTGQQVCRRAANQRVGFARIPGSALP